ncbi:MAG: heavy metal translocating P-type ATPase [Saprospiraceae bacterium]|nr:heavy metal translocating P-type ATPase [Saprospiraceae bacterium]
MTATPGSSSVARDRTNTELRLAIISGFFWLGGSIISVLPAADLSHLCFGIAIAAGGYFTLLEAIRDLRHGRFQIDFLMLVAAAGAAALGRLNEGALLLFLFSLGHALEHYAMKRARRSITALTGLTVQTALIKRGNEHIEIPIESLDVGDTIFVKPNSKIAADGIVIKGHSSVDESSITGESMPTDKHPASEFYLRHNLETLPAEHKVFAGTLNGSGAMEVKVQRTAEDSTISKLIALIKEAEGQKSDIQHFAEKFERGYVPIVLVLVAFLMFAFLVFEESFAKSFYRAMAVLIAASPCALAISTPSTVLAGIARGAREGILFKGGKPLEDLSRVSAIAFDKTGTLTKGKPSLTHVVPYKETSSNYLLSVAVAVESLSDHPLSAAIAIEGLRLLPEKPIPAEGLEALTARGIRASWNNTTVHIGNRRLMEEVTGEVLPAAIEKTTRDLESAGNTSMIVHQDLEYLGVISVMDVPRIEASETIRRLSNMGIDRMIMLTGDNQRVANTVARAIGIEEVKGSLLPQDKVSEIKALMHGEAGVAMIGDGVNDAPAMASSTVGIAMAAAGSDVALDTADIALMSDQIDRLPFAIALSRRARKIVIQNLWISLGMVAILVPLTILDIAAIGPAVIAHEGSTLVVVLNALRLLYFELKGGGHPNATHSQDQVLGVG